MPNKKQCSVCLQGIKNRPLHLSLPPPATNDKKSLLNSEYKQKSGSFTNIVLCLRGGVGFFFVRFVFLCVSPDLGNVSFYCDVKFVYFFSNSFFP